MKEYEIIREEMIQNLEAISNYNNILYTAVTLILSFTFNSKEYLACMLPYIVIISIFSLTVARSKGICKMGAYLYVFQEGTDFNWERRHSEFDEKFMDTEKKNFNWKSLNRFYLLSCVCSFITIYKLLTENNSNHYYKIIVSLVIIVFTLSVCIYFYRNAVYYTDERKKMIELWEKIKNEEIRKENEPDMIQPSD